MGLEKDLENASAGCGCLIMLAFAAIIIQCSGVGQGCRNWWDDWAKSSEEAAARAKEAKRLAEERERQAKEAAQKSAEEAELDAELKKFAKEFVPDLQQAIDKYEEQINQFTEQRAAFARDMAKLKIDPNTRPAYGKKGEIIEKMKQDSQKLLADRKETYIRWKELSLLRDTPDTKDQREKLLQSAQKAARSAEATFAKYMEQSLDPDGK